MTRKNYSQTSRDRLAFNFLIAIPVLAALVLIRGVQVMTKDGPEKLTP